MDTQRNVDHNTRTGGEEAGGIDVRHEDPTIDGIVGSQRTGLAGALAYDNKDFLDDLMRPKSVPSSRGTGKLYRTDPTGRRVEYVPKDKVPHWVSTRPIPPTVVSSRAVGKYIRENRGRFRLPDFGGDLAGE